MKQVITLLFLLFSLVCRTQDTTSFFQQSKKLNKKRLATVIAIETVGYSATIIGLNELWYKDYPRTNFHFFNDNDEWLQMDKIGHTMTSYFVGRVGMEVLEWSGVERKKAMWYGGTLGLAFLTSVEVLDGFSTEWGFSWGDQLANVGGTSLLIGQEYLWQEQRIIMKFSSHLTNYAEFRPNVLGGYVPERILKDYNGQTYWLSGNIHSFFKEDSKFPKWLNVALGYGGDGLFFGNQAAYHENCNSDDPNIVACFYHHPNRQFYLSLDVDLTKIKTRSHFLKTVLGTFNFIKIPFPTLEYTQGKGMAFRPFYY